ncbi:PTS sugar transporter subunit IIA [Parasphingopyxis lamellibrachiae]|uniref:Phosphotransferase IIA-like nitrogen-regulatory protein PtsN n=1 Tax=Parasphingopyxis lamellibrachiae TaxID=680125 RepID=A0A3D9FH43_9SPHN|nr:PTS sugar transporter subunit IIA [Parasphingopyxis lamellibrachiae]RED17103.1 phosphotransferase IIA-like nitrogen-regulatory protein PtsN [Parasphingopyxis lamellibrachiae]
MIDFDFSSPAFVVFADAVENKAALFRLIANHASRIVDVDAGTVEDQLVSREKLGSTGFGDGVAIPHGRIETLERPFGLFVRLDTPVDYASVDDLPVDCVFALFSPEADGAAHLQALARISRRFRDDKFVAKLRGARSTDAVFALLANFEAADAA